MMRRLTIRFVIALVALFTCGMVVGCASTSLASWPARDSLYRRYCALEVQKGALPYVAFESCVHRLTAHRGDTCTHVSPYVSSEAPNDFHSR